MIERATTGSRNSRVERISHGTAALMLAALALGACHEGDPIPARADKDAASASGESRSDAGGGGTTDGAGTGGKGTGDAGGTATLDAGRTDGGAGAGDTGGMGGADAGTDAGGETPPSCEGLADTCGWNDDEDCCASLLVPGGTFVLGRGSGDGDDAACDTNGGPYTCDTDEAPGASATVRAFRLDRFEVTVGRFRKFIEAGSPEPAAGAGKHGYLNGGGESGWDAAWSIPSTPGAWDTRLVCHTATFRTWTTTAGANEDKALNCLDWYSAYAFCIWDGGFLPTEAEWELAASGGEERVFPWSSPASHTGIDATRACYTGCGSVRKVGSKPAGDGRWGHTDLAGNVWEWVLDWYDSGWYGGRGATCTDCANLTSASGRVRRGGDRGDSEAYLRAVSRGNSGPSGALSTLGVRCARTP